MIELRATDEGMLLPVHAQPGSRQDRIVGEHDGRLKVAVTQNAERGLANRRLRQVLAQALGLTPSQVSLRSGSQSSRKTFLVSGVSEGELQQRISRCLRQ